MSESQRGATRGVGARVARLVLRLYPPRLRRDYAFELDEAMKGFPDEPDGTYSRWHLAGDFLWNLFPAWWDSAHSAYSDVRPTARSLIRAPAFTIPVIAMLAIGIGGATTAFTVLYGVLVRPLGYEDANQLYMIQSQDADHGGTISRAVFEEIRRQAAAPWSGAAAFLRPRSPASFHNGEWAEPLNGLQASHDLDDVLEVLPQHGRWFSAEESGREVIVISHRFWSTELGSDTRRLGSTIQLDDVPHRIIGVMPPEFVFPDAEIDYWKPLPSFVDLDPRVLQVPVLSVIARLRQAVSESQAVAGLAVLETQLRRADPTNDALRLTLVSRKDLLVGDVRTPLMLLFGAAALLLIAMCTNVGGLMVSRAARRRKDMAIRRCLGAQRGELARLGIFESLMLAGAGGLLGTFIAWGTLPLLRSSSSWLPRAEHLELDVVVLAFAIAVTLATAVLSGMWPVIAETRTDAALQTRSKDTVLGRSSRQAQRMLVVSQVGAAFVLVAGSLLMVNSLIRLYRTPPGFRTEGVLSFQIDLPRSRYRLSEPRLTFYKDLRLRLATLPGVEAVGLASQVFDRGEEFGRTFTIEGAVVSRGAEPAAPVHGVGIGYFETLGIPVVEGRSFRPSDGPETELVAVVSQAFARRHFGDRSALGARIRMGGIDSPDAWIRIAGIVSDTRRRGLREPPASEVFLPYEQDYEFRSRRMFVLLATDGSGPVQIARLRQIVAGLDAQVPIRDVVWFDDLLAEGAAQTRFVTLILSALGLVSLIVALLGMYGILAVSVATRTREMGIRIALGASSKTIVKVFLGEALVLAVIGVLAGLVVFLASGRVLAAVLVGVESAHLPTLVGVVGLLVLAALGAAYMPALRASRADPLTVIRAE